MHHYNLGFISDEDIYQHVKATVERYRRSIDLKDFNKNVIDPIKLTFDAKIYHKSFREIIESECIRQIDKSNNNHIGYFHQHLFKYAGHDWQVPEAGFDVINEELHTYVEMKNKHNTMNAASSQRTYLKMQSKLLEDDKAQCLLVEVLAKTSQNTIWKISIDGKKYEHKCIRRVSIDRFYEIVFGDPLGFFKLCQALPQILDDILTEEPNIGLKNSVYSELDDISPDLFKSLYLQAFSSYEGFDTFRS